MLGLLDQLSEEKGVPKNNSLVDKNIIKTENSTLDNSKKTKTTLSSGEKKRLTETFTLFNKLFFDHQKRERKDVKEKTLVSKISKDQEKTATPPDLSEASSKGGGLLSMILGGLALLAASVGGIIASISGFFGGGAVADFVTVIGKLGMMGALKILATTVLKKFGLGVLKKLPIIGGIIGLTQAVMEFKDGNIFKGIGYLISGLLNFVPIAGPWLSMGADLLIAFAESKGMFDKGGALSPENGWNTIKDWISSIGKIIYDNALYLPIIGTFKRFGMAYDSFKSGNVVEGLKQIGLGLLTFGGGGFMIKGIEVLAGWLNSPKESEGKITPDNSWMSRLKNWIKSKLKDLPDWLAAPLKWFGILDDEQDNSGKISSDGSKDASKGIVNYVKDVWDNIKGPMGDAVGIIGDFTKDAWEKTSNFAKNTWDNVMSEAPKVWDTVKEFSSKAWDKAKEAGTWFADSMKSMADKTKDMINKWIPGIVDTISGIADSAMKVLKGIADKIGGWIGNLFSSDHENKLKEKVNSTNKDVVAKYDDKHIQAMIVGTNAQLHGLEKLYRSSHEQTQLLGNLVNIGANSLRELKRMNGGSASGGNITVVQPSQQSPSKQMATIPNNRDGYLTSAYALG
jgi:hypothetical protein